MFSIVSCGYNIIDMSFDWRENIATWATFLDGTSESGQGEIVIAVNTSKDDTYNALTQYFKELKAKTPWSRVVFKLIQTDFPYTDPEFDGKIKNAALQAASQPYAILLDLDEVLARKNRDTWVVAAEALRRDERLDGLGIPSIDLCKDWSTMKSLGQKFYMVKTGRGLTRGVPAFARKEDGSIDITKSDTTEVLKGDQLAQFGYVQNPANPEMMRLNDLQLGNVPYVFHRGYEQRAQRIKQGTFWKPHWENRAKHEVADVVATAEAFDKIPVRPHGLQHWSI